jgi:hypothetical protein
MIKKAKKLNLSFIIKRFYFKNIILLQIEFRFNEQSTFGHTLFICGIISKVFIYGLGNFALLVRMDKNIND